MPPGALQTISIQARPGDLEYDDEITEGTTFNPTCMSPRGPAYLVAAADSSGAEVQISAVEFVPEPITGMARQELGELLAAWQAAADGPSDDDEHDAAAALADAVEALLDVRSGARRPGGRPAGRPADAASGMPAEVDGMPVRAAIRQPPAVYGRLDYTWDVILREALDPANGNRYRLCRVRHAGSAGAARWEVIDADPGARGLTWTTAAMRFARTALTAAAPRGDFDPLQEDRHLPR